MTWRIYLVIALSVIFFAVLYWGFSTVSPNQKEMIKDRSFSDVFIDENFEKQRAKESLSSADLRTIEWLENKLRTTQDSTLYYQEEMSSFWASQQEYLLAGLYAEKISEEKADAESWGITGTTYLLGIQDSTEMRDKSVLVSKAVNALENAISLDPGEIRHRINLALAYVEVPPENNPMKGIQLLLELNQQHPESVSVLAQLGRLAIRTGQYDRAKERLLNAYALDENSVNVVCLLANLSDRIPADEDLKMFKDKCLLLRNN